MKQIDDDPRTMRERMLAGDPYIADDPELAAAADRALRLMDDYQRLFPRDQIGAQEVLRDLVGSLGEGTTIKPPLFVDYGSNLHVGARVFANYGLVALDVATITIGDDSQIGPGCQLLTPTHPLDPQRRLDKWEGAQPITLGKNVWLGGGVIVCPGVTIGDNTVVGAGSVVVKDLPANCVAVGNPARVVKQL